MKYLYLLILPALTACSSFKNQNVNPKRETIDHGVVRPISSIDSTVPNISLTNVHVVSQKDGKITALRGNFPWTEENYQDLNKLGVKKVIVFKNNKNNEINREKNKLIEHGLKKENITHIDFDWKDNNNFESGCLKFLEAFKILDESNKNLETTYFHCTTGEDRTGALSALYQKYSNKNLELNDLFKNEMCKKGYEAGEPHKPLDVVNNIRAGLTLTFLKMYYVIDLAQKNGNAIDSNICKYDFSKDQKFLTSNMSHSKIYNCSNKEFSYVY